MDPLADDDHLVPPAFAAFLAKLQEVRDDVVEHLWRLKAIA
jgi:hypothetical protein